MRYVFAFLCLIAFQAQSQSVSKYTLGASIHGLASGAINTSSSNDMVNTYQTYKAYADSAGDHESFRVSFGASLWLNYFLNKQWTFQAGLSYTDIGFQRNQENIQFLDPIHPGIGNGRLLERSAGSGSKRITYDYRYRYLQIPLLANYNFYSTRDARYNWYFTSGLALNYLIDHRITATLDQFAVDGQNVFQLDSTGYEGRALALTVFAGIKAEYRLDKKLTVFVQPLIGACPLSVSKTKMQTYPVYLQINAGVQFALDFRDDTKKDDKRPMQK